MILKPNKTNIKRAAAACLMFAASLGAAAQSPSVTAKLDSASLMMGRMGSLQLQVVLDRGQQLKFPMFDGATQDGLIPLVADTVELRQTYSTDTVALGGNRIQLNCRFPMQGFVPGQYMIPAIPVVVGSDTVSSRPMALMITGPEVTANDSISPDVPPLGPYYKSNFDKNLDKIPDFVYYYWWMLLLIIAIIVALGWYVIKYTGKKIPWLKPAPPVPPYEKAMQALRSLRSANLCEQGQEKEYYSRLTDILREYLWGRFSINAMEMTSQQIRKAVRNSPDAKAGRKHIDDVLEMADFVKFAKMKPLPDDNVAAFENVARFVEETKPAEPDGQKNTNSEKSASAGETDSKKGGEA